MGDPKEILNGFVGGLGKFGEQMPELTQGFMGLLGESFKEGAISVKNKELIAVAIGAYNRCEYCIAYHVYKALEAGATRQEVLEAAGVAVAFGGGPSMAYTVTSVLKALDAFAPEFGK